VQSNDDVRSTERDQCRPNLFGINLCGHQKVKRSEDFCSCNERREDDSTRSSCHELRDRIDGGSHAKYQYRALKQREKSISKANAQEEVHTLQPEGRITRATGIPQQVTESNSVRS
jgi:hypothetical protein